MPRCDQRYPHAVRQPHTQYPRLARSSDVNNIWLEHTQPFFEKVLMPQKRGIECQIFFQTEGEKTITRNIECGQRVLLLLPQADTTSASPHATAARRNDSINAGPA